MASYGRHRVYALFWTWDIGPFVCLTDIESINGSKSLGSIQRCRINILPRPVPIVESGRVTRTDRGYLDVLRPNDWVFVFVDPFDGDPPEPLFFGFIDDVRGNISVGPDGSEQSSIIVSCSGWEKAINTTACISNAWVSSKINIATLFNVVNKILTDDVYIPTVPGIVASVIRAFLEADTSEASVQAGTNTTDNTREDVALREMRQVIANAASADESTSTTRLPSEGDSPIRALLGQFELPRTDIPLWQFINLRFEDLKERTFTTPQSMLNLLEMPLSRFIDEWANTLMNELIYDVRRMSSDGLGHLTRGGRSLSEDAIGGYTQSSIRDLISTASNVSPSVGNLFQDIAPFMVLMRRPLFLDEILVLDGPKMSSKDFVSLDFGFSDADHYNLSWIEPVGRNIDQFRAATNLTGFDANREKSIEMIRRHGLRLYHDKISAWPDRANPNEPPNPYQYSVELFADWNQRIQLAGLDQIELLTGSLSVPKFVRGLYMGGKLEVVFEPRPGIFQSGTTRVFYVDGYDWSYTASTGNFSQSISVIRGY